MCCRCLYLLCLILIMSPAWSRNEVQQFAITPALEQGEQKGVLIDGIKLYFGDQPAPKILKNFGEFATNKKTNAFGKSDKASCEWVFLSAIKQLAWKATQLGGNTVINIRSNYKHRLFSSSKYFQCGAGGIVSGVALKGVIVTTKR